MELNRRLLLIVCTFAAVACLMAPAPALYRVTKPDFYQQLKHSAFPWEHKGQSVEKFKEEEIRGRILEIPRQEWQDILRASQVSPKGILRADAPSIQNIVTRLTGHLPLRYLKASGERAGELLCISRIEPQDYTFSLAPFLLRHPYSPWSLLCFPAGLLFYIFLPRRRFSADTLSYGSGFRAVVGPDLIAWAMVTGFYTLGLAVGLSGAPAGISTLFSSNLIIATLVLWSFMLFGLYIFWIAARYEGLGLRCDGGHLTRFTLSGTDRITVNEVLSAELGAWQPSKWVTRFGFLAGLVSPGAMGPVLINAGRCDHQLELHLKDGRTWVYDINSAENAESVLSCLDKSGVQMDSDLRNLIR
jgi:hypothetical protein